jgi:hypothetical protein
MFITGAVIAASEMKFIGSSYGSGSEAVRDWLTGLAAMLGSIPLFISAKKNRKRAFLSLFNQSQLE